MDRQTYLKEFKNLMIRLKDKDFLMALERVGL
jgi:hypothetical protein